MTDEEMPFAGSWYAADKAPPGSYPVIAVPMGKDISAAVVTWMPRDRRQVGSLRDLWVYPIANLPKVGSQ